jgi:AcrR family transcriptional regulator
LNRVLEMATADTKDRILDAAEALFARQGFSSTSLRSVIAEAGVNLAAVHYHFGPREELIRAVFARRFDPINRRRIELLTALGEEGGNGRRSGGKRLGPSGKRLDPSGKRLEPSGERLDPSGERLEKILDILLRPLLAAAREKPDEWMSVSQLVGRAHTDSDFTVRQILHDQFKEVFAHFSAAIGRCLPHLGEEEMLCRFHFAITSMAVTLVHGDDIRILSEGRLDPGRDPEQFAHRWVSFAAAGLRAPASDDGGAR